jgi:hypothetical protein
MEVLLLLVMALSNIVCFMTGARVGQKVQKGEEVKLPTVNPMEIYREQKAKEEATFKQSQYETIMRNIDNYDGTSYGQEDVPRG